MVMSTADSNLNAAAVIFVNDLIDPCKRPDKKRGTLKETKRRLRVARVASVCLGIFSLFLALYATDYLELVLMSWGFYMPVVSVPFLLAIFGFRSSSKVALTGMLSGFITVILWKNFLAYTKIDSSIPGMLANLLGLLGSHYLFGEKGGWHKIGPTSLLAMERQERREAWHRRIKAIRGFKLYHYLQQNLPKQEYFYFIFGLYTIASTYAAFYTIGEEEAKAYQGIYGRHLSHYPLCYNSFLDFSYLASYG